MNSNPQAKRILCYGDSNIWGRSGKSIDRYPPHVRWTGLLQAKLGLGYEIIEEGLRSRTTNLEDDNPEFPGRNGLEYLRPCLESHHPLDLVVLWLGTNDFKAKFNRSAQEVSEAVRGLIQVIFEKSRTPDHEPSPVLLVSPPLIKEIHTGSGTQFEGAHAKSQQLGPLLAQVALEAKCEFLDLASLVSPGKYDGVHLEPKSHPVVAEHLYVAIRRTCP